ncbi:MAG: hypothetical protein JKY21_02380 [Alcanivorax sp.]|nr:hypothetical protein [Alcanivorax sp.]
MSSLSAGIGLEGAVRGCFAVTSGFAACSMVCAHRVTLCFCFMVLRLWPGYGVIGFLHGILNKTAKAGKKYSLSGLSATDQLAGKPGKKCFFRNRKGIRKAVLGNGIGGK